MTIFKEVPIGSAFEIRNGATPASDEEHYWNGDIAWVTPADLGALDSRTIGSGRRSITEEGYRSCAAELVPPGSLILSIRAPVGYLAIAETSMTFNQGCKGLVPRRFVDSAFAYWALTAFRKNLEAAAQGTTFAELSTAKLRAERIPVPDLSTQQTIAAFLDRETARIDQLIAKKERLIGLLEEKLTALIAAATEPTRSEDFEERKLGSLVTKIGSGKTPRGGADVYTESGVAFLRSQNVQNSGLRLSDIVYIPHRIDKEMAATRVKAGDVLLNITGASIGRSAVATAEVLPANVSQHVCIIRPSQSIIPEFLQLSIQSRRVQAQIKLESFSGNREGLNFAEVRSLLIAVPRDRSEQRRIVETVERSRKPLRATVTKTEDSIDRLRELRSALITAAVTGQIDVATWGRRGATDRRLDVIEQELAGVTG